MFNAEALKWTREPKRYTIDNNHIEYRNKPSHRFMAENILSFQK